MKKSRAEQVIEQREQQREKQQEMKKDLQREQGALREAFNQDGRMSGDFIRELLSDDDMSVGDGTELQTRTVAKIQNMLSRDWVLGNLTEAQEHDIRYKLEVMKLKVIGMHPPEESVVTGKVRAFLMDDPGEELQPLSQQQRVLIDELFETLKARLTRGREGFERQQMNTNIARTETGSDDDDESGGVGLFS